MRIGDNIRKIRDIKGFSQEFMANKLEMSQRNYCRLEKEEIKIDMNKINLISEVLDVSPKQIIDFDDKFLFMNCDTTIGVSENQNFYAFSEKERELYENRIADLQKEIDFLKGSVENSGIKEQN